MFSVSRYPGFFVSATLPPHARRERGTLPSARSERQEDVSAAAAGGLAAGGCVREVSRRAACFVVSRAERVRSESGACGFAATVEAAGFFASFAASVSRFVV